ncbi:MAG TPA: Rieske (2Fe-2S) protein [Longimicrobiales bacterium]|nr:Rieske (2Fe-2S) protein [Longimicrobiales bacterium]
MADDHDDTDRGRRRFLGRLSLAVAGLAALAASVPFIAFFARPARPTGAAWRDIGALDEFEPGSTRKVVYPNPEPDPWEGLAVRNAAWVRRGTDGSFTAFSIYCTHTGCPVSWVEEGGLFLCPCHGGVFDREGAVRSGPPSRPLDRARVRVRGGRVEIEAVDVPTPG